MILSVLSILVFVVWFQWVILVESRPNENKSSITTTVNPDNSGGGDRHCVFCNQCERGAIIVTCQPKEQCFSYSFISEFTGYLFLFINNLNNNSHQVNWKTRPKRVAHRRRCSAKTTIMNSSLNLLFATVVIGIFAIQRTKTGTVEEHRPKSFSPHFGC